MHRDVLKDEAMARLIELGKVSDADEYFERTFQSPAFVRAGNLIRVWMEEAGLKTGVTVQGALRNNSIEITEEDILQLQYDPESVWGYIEIHIEQGTVLETVGIPLGLVKGIAWQTRMRITVKGSQGHVGTIPMTMRQDPLEAAAELIVLLESLCKQPEDYLSYDEWWICHIYLLG